MSGITFPPELLPNLAEAQLGDIAQPHDCAELRGQQINRLKDALPQFDLLLWPRSCVSKRGKQSGRLRRSSSIQR